MMAKSSTDTRGRGRPRDPYEIRFEVRARPDAWERWRSLAAGDGVALATWMRQAGLEREAREDAGERRPAGTRDAIAAASTEMSERQYVRLSVPMRKRWTSRAAERGVDLSTWLRQAAAEKEVRSRGEE